MTDMKRITISLPNDLDLAVTKMMEEKKCSFSEIIRQLIALALKESPDA